MKVFAFLIGFVLLIALTRCGQSGAANDASALTLVALPDTVDLAYQDTLLLNDGQDWLTFDSLAHDSRCPTGASCVWEGNAQIGFSLFQDAEHHTFTLNTHVRYQTDTTLAALSLAVLDLTPYPHVDSTYKAAQYAVRIFVDR